MCNGWNIVKTFLLVLVFLAWTSDGLAENGRGFDEDEVFESGLKIHSVTPEDKKTVVQPVPKARSRAPSRRSSSRARVRTAATAPSKPVPAKTAVSAPSAPKQGESADKGDLETNIINSMLAGMDEGDETQSSPTSKNQNDKADLKGEAALPGGVAEDGQDAAKEEGDFPSKADYIADESTSKGVFSEDKAETGGEVNYVRMLVATLVIGGLIVLLAYLWKMLQTKSLRIFPKSPYPLKILSQQLIGARSRILIVEALGKKYLVGATPDRIQLLADLDLFGNEGSAESLRGEIPDTMDEEAADTFSSRIFSQVVPKSLDPVERKNPENSPEARAPAPLSEREKAAMKIREKLKHLKKYS